MFLDNKKIKLFNYAFFTLTAILFLFMHCYNLDSIPSGTHIDESGMGYDAWCISQYGVDRYLKSFPLYLTNFGGGQSSLYCYICSIFVKLFGLSNITMRIPAVIFSFLTLFYSTKIINLKYKQNKVPMYLYILLFIILPFFTMSSRFGLDCNLMLGMSTVFLYYYIKAIHKDGNLKLFFVSGVFAGLVLYTYALSYVVLPIFLLLSFCYLFYIKKIKLKQIIIFLIPLMVLSFPLIVIQVINIYNLPEMKLGALTLTKLPGYRGAEFSFDNFFLNAKAALKSVLYNDHLPYNASVKFKTMYMVSIPIMCIGLCNCICNCFKKIKLKKLSVDYFVLFWLVSEFFMSCLLEGNGPNTNKLNGIFFALTYLIVNGLICITKINYDWKKLLLVLITLMYTISYVRFTNYYFSEFKKNQIYFSPQYKEVVSLLSSFPDNINNRTTYVGSSYIYFLQSTLTSPYDFDILNNGIDSYKNYTFSLPLITEINKNSNYIIQKSNQYYINVLEELNFNKIDINEFYLFY